MYDCIQNGSFVETSTEITARGIQDTQFFATTLGFTVETGILDSQRSVSGKGSQVIGMLWPVKIRLSFV